MQDIKSKVENIVSKYEKELSHYGIRLRVSKKYREEAVNESTRSTYDTGIASLIVGSATDIIAKKGEKSKGYNHIRNRYHCLVITVLPIDKTKVPKDMCKEYSFFLKKIERLHIGLNPEKRISKEDKLLKKIEKRILKILSTAKKKSVERVCHDTIMDAFRYSTSKKYKYKKRILGKNMGFWHTVDFFVLVSFAVLVVLAVFLIFK